MLFPQGAHFSTPIIPLIQSNPASLSFLFPDFKRPSACRKMSVAEVKKTLDERGPTKKHTLFLDTTACCQLTREMSIIVRKGPFYYLTQHPNYNKT